MQVHSPLVREPLSMTSKNDPANVFMTECDDEYDTSSLHGKARTDKKRSWGIRKGLRMLSGGGGTSTVSGSSSTGSHLRSSSGSLQSIKYTNSDPSVDSFIQSSEFTLPRSILKVSKTSATSSGISTVSTDDSNSKECINNTVQKEKKKLRFHGIMSLCKICKVESYIQYKDEIWWSREEIECHKSEQSDFRSATSETKAIARNYLKAVRKGRSDIYDHFKQQTKDAATATAAAVATSSSSSSSTCENPTSKKLPQHADCGTSNDCSASFTTATTASSSQSSSCTNSPKQSSSTTTTGAGVKLTKPTIDTEIHNALVQGRANGFAGLELYAHSSNEKRDTVKSIVSNVVSYYHSRNDPTNKTKNPKTYSILEEKISNYCKSLTVADRYWAVIVAKVDQDGATTC